MAGIYIHIPFCKKACTYCNFHFSTSMKHKAPMMEAILQEIETRKHYLEGQTIETVYFGGGTPSILTSAEIEQIFDRLAHNFDLKGLKEVTLEANPDDLKESFLSDLKTYTPINRLSIGVQSFNEEELVHMNRAHSAKEAHECIELSRKYGFDSLSIDMIYGSPWSTMEIWKYNLDRCATFDIPHISSYCLTVEEKTKLQHQIKKAEVPEPDENLASHQFEYLVSFLGQKGYEHYEISNFAKKGKYALHNTNYWRGKHYLGIGPSAHSYNGKQRQWNWANNAKYIQCIQNDQPSFEIETLDDRQIYNEYVMTSLRTQWGINLSMIQGMGDEFLAHLEKEAQPFLHKKWIEKNQDYILLTEKGKLMADHIASSLFMI